MTVSPLGARRVMTSIKTYTYRHAAAILYRHYYCLISLHSYSLFFRPLPDCVLIGNRGLGGKGHIVPSMNRYLNHINPLTWPQDVKIFHRVHSPGISFRFDPHKEYA